jgi:hypothetical protein
MSTEIPTGSNAPGVPAPSERKGDGKTRRDTFDRYADRLAGPDAGTVPVGKNKPAPSPLESNALPKEKPE